MKERETSKLYNSITNVDDQFINEAQTKTKKKENGWLKWGAMVACLCLVVAAGIFVPKLINSGEMGTSSVSDAAPMVYVNDTLYKQSTAQTFYAEQKEEFVYVGEIESEVKNDQSISDGIPNKNFQANHSIVGSKIYQYEDDIVVEINGQYWIYCAVLDVDYTVNDDGTYTCRGNTYKYMIKVSGVDGESQITYIILTNNEETDFEDVSYSLRKAEMSTETPEFIILGWYY